CSLEINVCNKSPSSLATQYRREGYAFPLDCFSEHEVGIAQNALTEVEAYQGSELSRSIARYLRVNAHLVFPFVVDLARSPKLLDYVEQILGENILIYSAEFFIKEANTEKIVTWHQDLTYWGLGETDEELTAWIALSNVNVESGCMRFLPGSHHQRIQPHSDSFDENNLLSRGQEVSVEVDESAAVNIVLQPGQVSLHHGRMFHASGPNQSQNRRIGLVIRYITPQVEQSGARGYAMIARGIDTSGHWCHVAPPVENFEERNVALHNRIRAEQEEVLMSGASEVSKAWG
ncbi:MAG: phytanoyl-CoA dioxygenase family protein, partial [Pseudomonadota bacterium]